MNGGSLRLAMIWSVLLSLFWMGRAFGNTSDFIINTWHDHEGISEGTVLALAQSPDGYLWVGSEVGLLRFNGFDVTRADQFCDLDSLTEQVNFLQTDRSGRVWAGAEHGLAVYERGSWQRIQGTNYAFRSVAADINGRVLLGGTEGQLYTVNNYKVEHFQPPAGMTASGVFCLTDARDGSLWLANRGFIGRLTAKGWLRVGPAGVISSSLIAAPAQAGGIWVYTPGNLWRYQADGTVTQFPAPNEDHGRELREDHAGTIWLASVMHGLTYFRPGGPASFITATNGLTHNSIRCILEDTEGNIWAGGTLSGLNRLKPRQFIAYGEEDGLPDNAIRTVAEISPGRILVGTHGSGIARIQDRQVAWQNTASTDARRQYVWSLLPDRAGRLWIGTYTSGLWVQENGVKRQFSLPPPLNSAITCLMEDAHNRIWVGTAFGLGVIETNLLFTAFTNAPLTGCAVTGLAEDARTGTLWIGTFYDGVFQLEEGDPTNVTSLDGLPGQRISSLTMDTDGYLWVGVFERGLVGVHNGQTTWIGTEQGLPAQTIGSMLDDGRGAFWLGSSRGILRVSRDALHRVAKQQARRADFSLFNASDGLGSEYCTEGFQPAALRDTTGQLWFSTDRGIVSVDPARLHLNTNPAPVLVEHVGYTDRSGASHVSLPLASGPLFIPPGSIEIDFGFDALCYTAPEKAHYAYWLEGEAATWMEIGLRRDLHFRDLPPGSYVLHLKAANNDGLWNASGTTLRFTVEPFIWQTLWFRILGLVAVAGGGGFAVWRIMRQQYQQRIEHLQRQRLFEQEQARLAIVMENTSDLVVFADRQGGVIHINPAGQKLIGLAETEDLHALKLSQLQPRWAADRVATEGIPTARQQGTWEAETALLHRDGREIPVSQVVIAHKDKEGRDVFLSTIARDITGRKRAEEALRRSQERYEVTERAVHDGLWDWNLLTDEDTFSPRWKAILGYQDDELPNQKSAFLKLIHPDDRTLVDQATREHLEQGRRYAFEFRLRHKDGSYRWVFSRGEAMRNAAGRPIRMVGAITDITERKQAEEALARSEEKFRSLFANAPVGIFQSTSDRLLFVNPAMARMFGFASSAEMMAGPANPEVFYVHPEQRRRMIRAAMASGNYVKEEVEERRKDGSRFTTSTHMRVVCDGSGAIKFIEGFVEDITARQRAEESQARLATVVEQSAEIIIITDIKGTIVYVNPAFEKITGYPRAEAIGQNPRMLKSGRQDAGFYRQMWGRLKAGEVWHGHFINRRKDGSHYEEEATISPVRNEAGDVINYVGIKHDVTREVQLETELRQSQKMEAIGQLAGGVAHDFNNILAALLMQTDLLAMIEPLPAEVRDGLRDMRRDVNRATELTRQLLLFSRRQVMQSRLLDLNDIVVNLAKMLHRIIGEDVQLNLQLHPLPLVTHADPGMLEQVLMNLAVNARDAMPGGGGLHIKTTAVTVEAAAAQLHPEATPGRYVCLSVSDTGKGIPPEVLPRIFEPFFTTKEAGKGTGLGLATVFGIVKQHQGWIKVDNRPGAGVTFQVYLPASTAAATETSQTEVRPKPRGGTETILLVEDEAAVRKLTRRLLEQLGYRVVEAANGDEGLKCWAENHESVSLLLTDLVMPGGMSGQELARQLVAKQPKLKIVFTSGYSADIAGRNFIMQPGEAFIQKPFEMTRLAETIRRSLDE